MWVRDHCHSAHANKCIETSVLQNPVKTMPSSTHKRSRKRSSKIGPSSHQSTRINATLHWESRQSTQSCSLASIMKGTHILLPAPTREKRPKVNPGATLWQRRRLDLRLVISMQLDVVLITRTILPIESDGPRMVAGYVLV